MAEFLFFCGNKYVRIFQTERGGIPMSRRTVMFSNPDEVMNFVKTVEKYPYDMDVKRGKSIVDAKSLMGLLNLGLNRKIELRVYEEECQELFHNIEQYVVA